MQRIHTRRPAPDPFHTKGKHMRARTSHITITRLVRATLVGCALLTAVPASVSAAARGSFAPHLGRQIVSTRAHHHGPQLATWYGPGFYGNGTACGQTLRRGTWGIAHRTLPCGTLVTITHRGRKVSVRVIDRGPFSGATVDLTARTRDFLRFVSGTVRMSVIKRYRVLPRPRPTSGIVPIGDRSIAT